ncbi:MAG TPA: hypothetical protein VK806_01155 [Bacteroidia bacterium]|nr:hypothetical protein [Bacteroidia bacterium]
MKLYTDSKGNCREFSLKTGVYHIAFGKPGYLSDLCLFDFLHMKTMPGGDESCHVDMKEDASFQIRNGVFKICMEMIPSPTKGKKKKTWSQNGSI